MTPLLLLKIPIVYIIMVKVPIVRSAKEAAGEVFIPVMAGTATTLAPFFPLIILERFDRKVHDLPADNPYSYPCRVIDSSLFLQPGICCKLL